MKKIKLSVEDLEVRSFEVVEDAPRASGTVQAFDDDEAEAYTPNNSCEASCVVSICNSGCTIDWECTLWCEGGTLPMD